MLFRTLCVAGLAVTLLAVAPRTAAAADCNTAGPDLILTGAAASCSLAGVYAFNNIAITGGAVITVKPYLGGDKELSGNLELRANSIIVGAGSAIVAKGSGYQTIICGDGQGPTAASAGQGGCAVSDSGGGGAHFGGGGRGTKDISPPQQFPRDFEEDCGNSVAYDVNGVPSCSDTSGCRTDDGLPSVAGIAFFHSIYEAEFGASGGDKGCRDGDGTTILTAGPGGGRIVLAATNPGATISIAGTINTNGRRGCGDGNDSAGGGAGGSILIAGDDVTIGASALVTAAGGLGGDTSGATDPTGECVGAPYQQSGTCDDCGGGGGGGIVSVLSVTSAIDDRAIFSVSGAVGGTCTICQGEAGGGAGELQIAGGYVGEYCDGYDNDFDDAVDEDILALDCAGVPTPACVGGVPQTCPADVPACIEDVTDTRARFAVVVDTSGSMLGSLAGVPTFGDGSIDHPGRDQNGTGGADDSRLYQAKGALTTVIAAYPEIDFALARYHQDTSLDRACQLAHNFECRALCCSYDNPGNNTGIAASPACVVNGGTGGNVTVLRDSPGDECVNYAGNCGPPRRGADVLVGFGADINQYLSWLDGAETAYDSGTEVGNYCAGGDCELRGTGPTPLANSLQAAQDYLVPIKGCDAAAIGSCRRYGVILLTDGAESCQGDPVAAATALRNAGIDTYVVGFSVLSTEQDQLNAIAAAGGTGTAFLVGNEDQLANALASIVSGSIVFETCNDLDDDCDTRVDEDFPQKGTACADAGIGACQGFGALVCGDDGASLRCDITDPGDPAGAEGCNGADDDCDGKIDEGLECSGCVPTGPIDLCNGLDDDCDGAFEEDDPDVGDACGSSDIAPCHLGVQACIGGGIVCVGAVEPGTEACNGLDDDCDGNADDLAPCPGDTSCVAGGCRVPCAAGEFPCAPGLTCLETVDGDYCVPSPCAACGPNEICQNDACIDPCADVTCGAAEECRLGTCVDCDVLGCLGDLICLDSMCVADPCAGVDCATGCADPLGCSCVEGACVDNCDDNLCPDGQRCGVDGACRPDTCADVTCGDGERCEGGACVPDPCDGVTCQAGDACVDGDCVEDPCKLVTCSTGYQCEVRDGATLCLPTNPAYEPDWVFAGGSGCAAGGGGASAVGLVALALFGLTRRRRSGVVGGDA